jgi:hypothetical protein
MTDAIDLEIAVVQNAGSTIYDVQSERDFPHFSAYFR